MPVIKSSKRGSESVGKLAEKRRVKQSFWRADWFLGACLIALLVTIHGATDFFGAFERRFYDFASTSTERQPSDQIAIIAIDNESVANIGRWPWSRDVHAQLIDQLSAAKVKTIAHTVFFFEPQIDRGLAFIRQLKELLAKSETDTVTNAAQMAQVISEAELVLDSDAKLVDSLRRAGNVLIPSLFTLGTPRGRPDTELPLFAAASSVNDPANFSTPALRGQQPWATIGLAAGGVGHLNQWSDADGSVRREPLLVNYFGLAIPSMSLLIAAKSLNLTAADITANAGESVQLGKLIIKTDSSALMLPQFYRGRNGQPAFAVDSFYDVLSGKIPASKYTGKIVIIGATAAGVGSQFATPAGGALSPAETIAHITSSILSEHFIVEPAWSHWALLAALLMVAAYLLAGLPRLSAGKAALATLALFVLLLGMEFVLLSGASMWLPLVFPAAVLAIGHLALTTKRFLMTEAGWHRADEESAETSRMMGLAYQGQGQLDMAFDRFCRVPFSDALMDNLSSLALDFERKRQFNKAQAVYEHMARHDKGDKGLQSKINRVKNLSDTVILGGRPHAGGALLFADGSVEKPMLGRYQIDKELAKGAMGVVYLGKDPKIGRVVAIKTLALSQEFEGSALDDARQRFFREAETAGRLQHQNIVTIFDAGEEQDLAYIAMEFLKGTDLASATSDGSLLPVSTVLSIVAKVAEALAYAHMQHVVHRDIKPANIMYDAVTGVVKVTDFGIARITDSSRTKTGLVLGTPSFMSPEQIAGHKVDGRSDLYSLGVMLFQLLTGKLPFRGDSMAQLMFKIANEPAPDVRTFREALQPELALVVARALAKQPVARYQDGNHFAADLQLLIQEAGVGSARSQSNAGPAAGEAQLNSPPMPYDATLPMGHTDAVAGRAAAHRNGESG
jgi:serine/threonine-protein kinase